jgi:hypothetical protein
VGNRALELGEQVGDTEIIVHSLSNIGTIELLTGSGTATLERSLELADQASLDEHVGRAFINLAWGVSRTRDYRRAHWLDDGVAACDERGLETWRLYVLVYRARFDLDQGRWTEAADAAATVLRYPRGALLLRLLAPTITGLVRARRGDPGRWEPLDEAQAIARHNDDLQWIAPVALARAEAAWLDGLGADTVRAETQDALDLAVTRRAPWVIGELLLWRRLASIDENPPAPVAEPFALQLNGDWAGAAARWTQIGCRYEAALALGEPDEDATLRRSLDELQRLGARQAAPIIARRLRERGVKNLPRGPRSATQANPANLTPRELGVLGLVAQGCPTPRSRSGCSCRRRPPTSTCRPPFASSARGPGQRQASTPCDSGSRSPRVPVSGTADATLPPGPSSSLRATG